MNKLISYNYVAALYIFVFVGCSKSVTVFCNHGDKYIWNDLCILNNQWGAQHSTNPDHFQCIRYRDNRVNYKWLGSFTTVKGMPVIMAGWHYGKHGGWVTPYGKHNLPSKISENKKHHVHFTEVHEDKSTCIECLNCCVDIWLSRSKNGGNDGEVMVWGNYINQQPLGNKIGLYMGYEVWKGDAGGWMCVTFRKTGSWEVKEDMNSFINYTISQGWFNDDLYITGIECGNEIMQGEGSFTYDSCSIE
ncbi:MAG: hypothetical protein ABR936_08855 [Bacteroidota bacterium]|jgi:hypothetical protein